MAGIKKHLVSYQRDTYTNKDRLPLKEGENYLDCALGTNPFGCSEKLLQHPLPIPGHLLSDYPQPDKGFIQALLNYWRRIACLRESQLRLEAGTFGVIERLHKLYMGENGSALGYCPQFSDYMQDVTCCGGIYQAVPLKKERNYSFNAEDLLSALNPDFNLVYLDNPNNPTGQVIPVPEIEKVVKAAEHMGVSVLIDEAYGDFMPLENSAISLVPHYDNLYVARSFTKGFGLAGLRVGYVAMSKALEDSFAKVEHPFPVNAPGQLYAALALQDITFLLNCQEKIRAVKACIMSSCSKLHILATDPATPIMTLVHPDPETNLFEEFLQQNVITTSGEHFQGLAQNSVRLRIPREPQQIIKAIRSIED